MPPNSIKTEKIRSKFTVKGKKFLTPHFIRVAFEIDDQQEELLTYVKSGSNNKLFIPAKSLISSDEKRIKADWEFITRTYTNRKIDLENRELLIDFVAHGDNGPASAWALTAVPGETLEVGMKQSSRPLVPDADFYLFIGDATALPVICAIVEELPSYVTAKVLLEVYGKEDEMILCSAADVSVHWLHNAEPEKGSILADTARNIDLPGGILKKYIYAAAEYSTIKAIKDYFKTELNWDPYGLYTCSYWKSGQSEEEGKP
ncbi:siderophore-interacting protein [Chryseobacterium vaccae]|uniref:siderophore-interacting protein n=1 Tax=Chryseobacterium vaccae TaxID=2604424 RepID=UPI001295E133|nr:siderophore-interacting protein [Chryseobacterium vaccae]